MTTKFNSSNRRPALALSLIATLAVVALTDAQSGAAAPPRIIATSPAVGAKDVDPSLTEITVTFDQDMSDGMSWTGGGPAFPSSTEGQKAQWKDKRSCVLPVNLQAAHYYRVGINSKSYHGFQSADGIPAQPSAIYFTTQGSSEELKTTTAPPRITATSPAIGATDVDPSLTEITVTFDQDMSGGMSWTGGGPAFPADQPGQKAHWKDKRTCVLPVKLDAAHYYRVGINSMSYHGFSSASGAPAMPSAIFFATQGASEQLKAWLRAPTVLRCQPENGAQEVSPTVTELRVTFSVPMGGGCSWCRVGDDDSDFPKGVEGKHYHWTPDKKTCVLPVALEAGRTYRLSLNAPGYNNFQSAAGVPLEPVSYTFKTSANP